MFSSRVHQHKYNTEPYFIEKENKEQPPSRLKCMIVTNETNTYSNTLHYTKSPALFEKKNRSLSPQKEQQPYR